VKTDIKIGLKSVEEGVADTISIPTATLLIEWEATIIPRFALLE
jgi:hypothetical protein